MNTADLNDYINSHQAIVVAVGIPLLTAFAAGLVSYITNRANLKSQMADRHLQRRMRIYESRQQKVAKLRDAMRRIESITLDTSVDLKNGLSSGKPDLLTGEKVRSFVTVYIEARNEVALLVDPNDAEVSALDDAFAVNPFTSERAFGAGDLKTYETAFPICRRILMRMEQAAERELLE